MIEKLKKDPKNWNEAIRELKNGNPDKSFEQVAWAADRLYPHLRQAALKNEDAEQAHRDHVADTLINLADAAKKQGIPLQQAVDLFCAAQAGRA